MDHDGLLEQGLNTLTSQRTAFKVLAPHISHHLISSLVRHLFALDPRLSIVPQVLLISHENELRMWRGLANFRKPLFSSILKGAFLSNVENHEEYICLRVTHLPHAAVLFLARGVP